jgi:hypothetical protein
MERKRAPDTLRLGKLFRGHAHRDYARHRQALEPIFSNHFPEWSRYSQQTLETALGILQQRLHVWKQKWEQDPTWWPWHFEVHGAYHHIFSDEEESVISDHISENDLILERLFTSATFVQIVPTAWLEKHRDTEPPFEFQDSAGFVADFKQRNHFSSRRAHMMAPICNRGRQDALDDDAVPTALRCIRS